MGASQPQSGGSCKEEEGDDGRRPGWWPEAAWPEAAFLPEDARGQQLGGWEVTQRPVDGRADRGRL